LNARPHIIEEYVRWSDVDLAGILRYDAYLRFFEIAETELFRAAGLAYHDCSDRYDIWFPRAAIHSEFFRPARLDDRLRVAAYVGRVGTKSLTINFEVLRNDPVGIGASGSQVLVCVRRTDLRPREIPPQIVAALTPHTLTPDAARSLLGVRAS
jgi:YbgC/YbaW family acyl-CoA thioester hydrolase